VFVCTTWQLILLKEILTLFKNNIEHTDTIRGQHAEVFEVIEDGTCNHWALNLRRIITLAFEVIISFLFQ
jgi:hypothetical protein